MKKKKCSSKILIVIKLFILVVSLFVQPDYYAQKPGRTNAMITLTNNGAPENIILTWKGDPATTQAVTWRTDESITEGYAEIAIADAAPTFTQFAVKLDALTEKLETVNGIKYYHSVNFNDLNSNTLYAYRVGIEGHWSEWFHFRTSTNENKPFSFIYFGDAQNNVLSLWARAIRSAYSEVPKAKFMIHAGDLINRPNDNEWREWFEAGDWIHAMIPSIPTPGNHEYAKLSSGDRELSKHWRAQFSLPENGVSGLEESVYFTDYEDLRIISLNSNEKQEEQVFWMEKILKSNPNKWVVITYHHPLYSSGNGRDNKKLRELWKPIFDKYQVDIALQGHDHTYARGRNLASGINVKDGIGGTMYVVSVSGPKMYQIHEERWMDRAAENTQLFQVINIDNDTLNYKAITVTGQIYDEFNLIKQVGKANILVDKIPFGLRERDFNSKD